MTGRVCHWPGCDARTPLYRWACRLHIEALPPVLRQRIEAQFVLTMTGVEGASYRAIEDEILAAIPHQGERWITVAKERELHKHDWLTRHRPVAKESV